MAEGVAGHTPARQLVDIRLPGKIPDHARHHRLLHVAQLAMDLSRQRAVRRDRRAQWRDRQHQALQVRADLRADRRAAAAEALAAAARLPDDGVEALARGAGHSDQSRTEAFSLRRRCGDPPGDRGQAAGQECAQAVAGARAARYGNARKRSPIPAAISSAAQRAGLDAAELRAGGPSDAELDGLHEKYTQEALARASSARRATCCLRARSSGARTGWTCWNAR